MSSQENTLEVIWSILRKHERRHIVDYKIRQDVIEHRHVIVILP